MTSYAPDAVPGRWLTAAEVARASDLREDLVERFLPAEEPPTALYSRDLVTIARFVKQLVDLGTPAAAVEVAVAELHGRPDAAFAVALGNGSRRGTFDASRARLWGSVTAAMVAALIIGGVVGSIVTPDDSGPATASAPTTVVKAVPAEAISAAVKDVAAVPAKPDPACAEWGRAVATYGAKQQAWAKTDPRVPASRWSPKQRTVTMAVIPVMKEEAAALRRLADRVKDPLLAGLLRRQAAYEDAYASRLPNFHPDDHAYWRAVTALSGTVKAVCAPVK